MRRAAAGPAAALAAALLLLAAPLAAQTDAETAVAPEGGSVWSDAAAEAIFADEARSTLRPEAEIRERWGALGPEAREEVLRDCAAIAVDAQDIQGAASGGVMDAEGGVAVPGAEGAPPPGRAAAATAEACAIVGGL